MKTPRTYCAHLVALALLLTVSACTPNDGDTPNQPAPTPAAQAEPATSDGGGADDEDVGEEPADPPPDVPKPDPEDYPGKDERTAEGAEQAFRYYVAQTIWSYQTGDGSILSELYEDGCESCQVNQEVIDTFVAQKQYWSEVSLEDVYITSFEDGDHDFEVGYVFVLGEHTEPVDGNVKNKHVGALEHSSVGGMIWKEDTWLVADFVIENEEAGEA